MSQRWNEIYKNETYLGDLKDFNGRRIALIVHKGIGVFAQCPAEKHYLFKEDFEALANTLNFVFAAKIDRGIFSYNDELDSYFDIGTIEEIHSYLSKTLEEL